jgi:DNA-binding response OmpR family regulator
VLVVTAHADAVAEPDMLGANAIIAKPFDVEVLLAKLDELLA